MFDMHYMENIVVLLLNQSLQNVTLNFHPDGKTNATTSMMED